MTGSVSSVGSVRPAQQATAGAGPSRHTGRPPIAVLRPVQGSVRAPPRPATRPPCPVHARDRSPSHRPSQPHQPPPGNNRPSPERPPMIQPDTPLLLTVEQAAERLGIGRTLAYALVSAGEIESVQIGRLRRIPADALPAFLDKLRGITTDRPAA